jgi:hypothetical protein
MGADVQMTGLPRLRMTKAMSMPPNSPQQLTFLTKVSFLPFYSIVLSFLSYPLVVSFGLLASIYTEPSLKVVKVFSGPLLDTLQASGLTYLRAVLLFRAVFYEGPSVVDSCLDDSLVSPVRLRDPLFLLKSSREAASGGCGQH